MQISELEHISRIYSGVADLKYIEECKRNSSKKSEIELELLYSKNFNLPISSNMLETKVFLPTLPGSLENTEIILEWIREIRDKDEAVKLEDIFENEISRHEGFVSICALNNLRRNHIPNFMYYYGVLEKDNKYYAITEEFATSFKEIRNINIEKYDETSSIESINSEVFMDFDYICENEDPTTVLSYFLCILMTLYTANKEFNYTNYSLTCKAITMKFITASTFDVEYKFEGDTLWISNNKYIPLIKDNSTSYVKLVVDDTLKSFGYNNLEDIPYEAKGVHCDKGFVITDAYKLLIDIMEVTKISNPEVYDKFVPLYSYFSKESPDKCFGKNNFIPYYSKTSDLHIRRFIKYTLNIYPDLVSVVPKNDVLRCIGTNLVVKSKHLNYYTIRTVIQLYDFLKYYSFHSNESNTNIIQDLVNFGMTYYSRYFEKKNLKRETNIQQKIRDILYNQSTLFEVPFDIKILQNEKYTEILCKFLKSSVTYYNTWDKSKTKYKIFDFLRKTNPDYELIFEDYCKMMNDNYEYYQNITNNLIEIRDMFRQNLHLYKNYTKEIIFLESLVL